MAHNSQAVRSSGNDLVDILRARAEGVKAAIEREGGCQGRDGLGSGTCQETDETYVLNLYRDDGTRTLLVKSRRNVCVRVARALYAVSINQHCPALDDVFGCNNNIQVVYDGRVGNYLALYVRSVGASTAHNSIGVSNSCSCVGVLCASVN